jgi:hypothetical protein
VELLLPALVAASVVVIAKLTARPRTTAAREMFVPDRWVGNGWTSWPQKDKYPTEGAVAGILTQLGYNPGAFASPGYKITSSKGQDAIGEFQNDANTIYDVMLGQGKTPPFPFLTVTGFVDPPTFDIMLWALTKNWQHLRDEAYGA